MSDYSFISSGLSKSEFESIYLDRFQEQYKEVEVYRKYCDSLGRTEAKSIDEIPFLPISFFKSHEVLKAAMEAEKVFLSSGTGNMQRSKHQVPNLALYEESFLRAFEHFYGDPSEFCLLALLPSYQEQGDSSLIYMVDHLMKKADPKSKYLKLELESAKELSRLSSKSKVFLIGVTYALLELAQKYPMDLSGSIIMETGGMKGRRKELIREEVHNTLCRAFNVTQIHSEYGMTELLSQAYSQEKGKFFCPPWMKVMIRESTDPFRWCSEGKSGGINIIDLANVHSCSFIETQDLGRSFPDGSFEVLGRFDQSDIRGCNLLQF